MTNETIIRSATELARSGGQQRARLKEDRGWQSVTVGMVNGLGVVGEYFPGRKKPDWEDASASFALHLSKHPMKRGRQMLQGSMAIEFWAPLTLLNRHVVRTRAINSFLTHRG